MRRPGEHSASSRQHAERLIDDALEGCDVGRLPGGATDVTHLATKRVLALCRELVHSGLIVLHGSHFGPLGHLEPRQGNDAAKQSGNRRAVYATVSVEAALAHAVVNKPYLLSTLRSFTLGYVFSAGRIRFRASDNLYRLFLDHAEHLCADGYVYVFAKDEFTRASDTLTEYQSPDSQLPLVVLKVPGRLRDDLFIVGRGAEEDTVVEYSREERTVIDAHVRRLHGI